MFVIIDALFLTIDVSARIPISTYNLGFLSQEMANEPTTLERRLDRVEDHSQRVLQASTLDVRMPQADELWWPFLVEMFGSTNAVFTRTRIDRDLFESAYTFVRDIPVERRGKKGAVRSNREKLFFVMVFMMKGVEVLEILVGRFIKTRSHIEERARTFAGLFIDVLVDGAVRFFDETHPLVPGAALIVDCTVCEIRRPGLPFKKAKQFFSGKHSMYCLKKEVCVNVRTGTAALISPAFPGSVHDISLLRSHAQEVRDILGEKALLADLGYRGAENDIPTIIVCDEHDVELRSRRVLVECFFGRLKTLFYIFSHTWAMKEEVFDLFFNLACAMTNLDILNRPLQSTDYEFNRGVYSLVMAERLNRRAEQRRANAAYRQRRLARIGLLEAEGVDFIG